MQVSQIEKYEDLVQTVRNDYKNNPRDNGQIRLEWCDTGNDENLCQEINLWTYWQGWKWAERKSNIKFLVLGQDWGCPSETMDGGALSNIRDMNKGIDVMYLDGCNLDLSESTTDKNLIFLFNKIGYRNIDKRRYPDLFFSNFSLGYRTGNNSGGMTDELMDADAVYIKKLVEILQPEKILCLGESVSKATFKMLFGKNEKYTSYNQFVSDSKGFKYHGQDFECIIYPLFHTGHYGVKVNRTGGLDQHMKDWENILK